MHFIFQWLRFSNKTTLPSSISLGESESMEKLDRKTSGPPLSRRAHCSDHIWHHDSHNWVSCYKNTQFHEWAPSFGVRAIRYLEVLLYSELVNSSFSLKRDHLHSLPCPLPHPQISRSDKWMLKAKLQGKTPLFTRIQTIIKWASKTSIAMIWSHREGLESASLNGSFWEFDPSFMFLRRFRRRALVLPFGTALTAYLRTGSIQIYSVPTYTIRGMIKTWY